MPAQGEMPLPLVGRSPYAGYVALGSVGRIPGLSSYQSASLVGFAVPIPNGFAKPDMAAVTFEVCPISSCRRGSRITARSDGLRPNVGDHDSGFLSTPRSHPPLSQLENSLGEGCRRSDQRTGRKWGPACIVAHNSSSCWRQRAFLGCELFDSNIERARWKVPRSSIEGTQAQEDSLF